MNASPEVLMYALSTFGAIILGLIAVIWRIMRQEAKLTAEQLEKKASAEAFRELKLELNTRFQNHQADYDRRLEDLVGRHEREMDEIKSTLTEMRREGVEMRRENATANSNLIDRIQQLTLMLASVKVSA